MIEAQYTQHSDSMNPVRVKKFVKHVILAAKKQHEREQAKQNLAKQLEKVKTATTKKANKTEIEKELKKLEKKLNDVLQKEGKIISEEKKDRVMDQSLKGEIRNLEVKIKQLSDKDTQVIEMLVNQIKGLEHELRITEGARHKEATDNKFEINQLSRAIVDMRERLKQSIEQKQERDKRIEEIEKKIKEKVGKNYNEIVKLEKQLLAMEDRYELAKKEGKYDKSILEEIEDRIKIVKQRLIMRRAGIGAEESKFIPTIKKKEKRSRLFFKKKSIPTGPIKLVKHNLKITPVKDKEPVTSGKLPPLPPGPPLPKELEELRKEETDHKGIMERIKDLFRKKPKNLPAISSSSLPVKIEG